MKKLLLLLTILATLHASAQNYQITFTGSGASASVSSVKVDNLTSGATANLTSGTDILNLSVTTAVNSPDQNPSSALRIYPNPMTDHSTLDIFPPVKGETVITIYEITGKPVAIRKVYLDNSRTGFRLSGLKKGMYIVDVKGKGFRYSGKLVSNGASSESISIEKDNTVVRASAPEETKTTRSSLATVDMAYTTGDVLKISGKSGNYTTIVMDVPVASKNINFEFVACTDGDFNVYPVVKINDKFWMAANLKATKYNDGMEIPNVTDNTAWSGLSTGAYSDYSNVPVFSNTYGRLYNWYAIASTNPKNVCPSGWHVSTDAEWTALANYLGGAIGAAGKLKETGIISWASPNIATNSTGFTALPGGDRGQDGTYGLMGRYGFFWTSTQGGTSFAFYRYMINSSGNLGSGDNDKRAAFSVRCVK
jgi:uncharacterized protein (TIGR02145 family)